MDFSQISKTYKSINAVHRNIIEILRHAISFILQIILTITSILLQFHLLISLIAGINPFSGCLHCLEVSQVVCDANRLTSFSVMGISFEGSSQAICKMIFFVNRILLLLPVLRPALIFLIFVVYLVFFTLYRFSTLVCAYLVGKSFGRFTCLVLIDVYWHCSLVCTCAFGHTFVDWRNTYFQICWLIWSSIVGQCEFSTANILFSIKSIKIQSLLIHSHSHVFSHYACFFRNNVLLFLFLAVFLILKLNGCKRSGNSCV